MIRNTMGGLLSDPIFSIKRFAKMVDIPEATITNNVRRLNEMLNKDKK